MNGSLEHAREIQSMIGEVRQNPAHLEFQPLRGDQLWLDVVFIGMGDQAHTNREKGGSTGGLVHLAAGPESIEGTLTRMSLLTRRCWKLKRRAIGSNDAKVQSILEAKDVIFRAPRCMEQLFKTW